MPARAELLAQLAIVINLAVRHKPQRTVRVRERLMTASEVDDREPAHADRTWAISINAIVVRSAVNDGLAHSAKSFHRRGLPVELQDSVDSAHSEVFYIKRSMFDESMEPARGALWQASSGMHPRRQQRRRGKSSVPRPAGEHCVKSIA